MSGMTRGRLPARVYWVRRLMVLGIATLLVVGIARMLGGSSNGSSGDAARNVAVTSPAAGETSSTPASGDVTAGGGASYGPSDGVTRPHRGHRASASVTPVVMPSGPCAASDVAVTPSVPQPVAGRDITVILDISSLETPACTWTLSARSLALKITSGKDLIWTSAQCGRMIPQHDLVLRQTAPTQVKLTWNAQRSAPGCPVHGVWALPGTYHLDVAALAGQPQDVTFALTAPTPAEVTRTAHPHKGHHHGH